MATQIQSISTSHGDLIHDAKFDYFGKRLATCSSDSTIKIFEVLDTEQKQVATLKAHKGPVWMVDWAHPKFGTFLASCSYDRRVIIWSEKGNNKWIRVHTFTSESSVNAVAWSAPEMGLTLAGASSDCSVFVISYDEKKESWGVVPIKNAHKIGCTSVSWCSCAPSGSLTSKFDKALPIVKRFVSGGCDKKAIIWKFSEGDWKKEKELIGHKDWVRDVAWAPNIGLPYECIATCSQDKTVCIWKQDEKNSEEWDKTVLKFKNIVWKVSWSITGNVLAVTTGNNEVTMWKENLNEGEWQQIGKIAENDASKEK